MPKKYALINNNTVINVFVWDGKSPYEKDRKYLILPLDTLPAGVGKGFRKVGDEWLPPLDPEE